MNCFTLHKNDDFIYWRSSFPPYKLVFLRKLAPITEKGYT